MSESNTTSSGSTQQSSQNDAQSNKPNSRGKSRNRRGRGRGGYNYIRKNKKEAENNRKAEEAEKLPETSSSVVKQKKTKKQQKLQKQEITEQGIHITKQLRKGAYECMVCFDRIGKKAGIWNCESCFAIFHIGCIQKWSKASSDADKQIWACPACRSEVRGRAKSRCFCGKVAKPNFDPYLVPHSCGEPCRRKREGSSCTHLCTQICHPGSCPMCPALGKKKKCFCKKTVYQLRCGEVDDGRSCDNTCGNMLNCKMHRCKESCHSGECEPCAIPMERSCYCGKNRKSLFCGEGTLSIVEDDIGYFTCDKPCGRQLECGNHFCTSPCHPGACKPCETGLQCKTCFCGAFQLSKLLKEPRKSCLDPIPVCHSVCERRLPCSHECKGICHPGDCQPCIEKTKVTCRCGKTQKTLPCSELYINGSSRPIEVLCDDICKCKKSCNKHKCNTVCCPVSQIGQSAHPCTTVCDRLLSCKNHHCALECHRGRCPPCLNASFDELSCECGKTIIYPPVACGTPPPSCPHPCSREHVCDHEVHHQCHYEAECPKCYNLVTRQCGCGNRLLTTKCFIEFPCCGDLCKKPLKCGQHFCQKPCHGGSCEDEAILPGESCGIRCNADILTCDHKCNAPCHPGEPCPQVICQESVNLRCPCGNNIINGICLRGGPQGEYENDKYIRLECNDMCALKIRQQQLAAAFGRAEDLSDIIPTYPITLTNAAMSCPKFVKQVEKFFANLIAGNDQAHQFPPMNSFYRSVIHQLAEFYKLESVSYDQEPRRNVCVTKTFRSAIPSVILSVLVSRHPVPKQPGTGEGINKTGKPSGLLFYELNSSILSENIHHALRAHQGEYFLKWIDDTSAIVMFNDEKTMKIAAYNTSSLPWFKTLPIHDTDAAEIFASKISRKNVSSHTPPGTPDVVDDDNEAGIEEEKQKLEILVEDDDPQTPVDNNISNVINE